MSETTTTISAWAEETFGAAGSNARVAARANEEMAELLRAVTSAPDGTADAKTIDECADIVIVLSRLVHRCGGDLQDAVDRKMKVNRARVWERDGSGHGYHVKQP